MRTKVFRPNIAFGVLVAFVLAFGVQGIVDAADLPLSKTSGDLQTESVGETFEISFSVGIRSNTTAIRNMNQLTNEAGVLIDSAGYPVLQTGNLLLRRTTVMAAASLTNRPGDHPAVQELQAGNNYAAYAGLVRADASRYAYSQNGLRLYFHRPANPDPDGDPNTNDAIPESRIAATVTTQEFSDVEPTPTRYHYNQEKITITVDKDPGGTFMAEAGVMTFKLKAAGFQRDITELSEDPKSNPNGIPRSITLICTPTGNSTTGRYKVRISDNTPPEDTPWAAAPATRAYIEFTLFVVEDTADQFVANSIEAKEDAVYYGGEKPLELDNYFVFYETTVDAAGARTTTSIADPTGIELHYQVTEGPGTVFIKTTTGQTSPVKSLLTSAEADVHLNMNRGRNVVIASITGQDPNTDGAKIVFYYQGSEEPTTTTNQQQNQQQQTTPNSLSIIISGSGNTRTLLVGASRAGGGQVLDIGINLSVNGGSLSTTSGLTPLSSTWTLPTTAGTYTVTASTSAGYRSASESVTVTVPGTLTAVQEDSQVRVTASPAPSSELAFTLTTSGGISAGGGTILTTGTGRAIPILTAGTYILTVRAERYNATQVSFTPGTTPPTTGGQPGTGGQPPAPTGPAGVADSIEISGSRQLTGTVNRALRLRTRVTDANGTGVSNIKVAYQVLAPGKGRLSQRGNGRGVQARTDRQGYTTASLTPLGGNLIVEAKATGVSAAVTFIINVGDAPDETETPPPDDMPPDIIMIDPVVHVKATNRPPMLWVDQGTIYALVGEEVQPFIPSVDTANNIAIGDDKLYWTEQTGESAGTINSANLDGSDVKELKEIQAVPMGIAVDVDSDKLYWTNSRGRVQSANLDGSGIRNLVTDQFPTSIIFNNGSIYFLDKNPSITAVSNIFIFEAEQPQDGSGIGISGKNINDFVISGGKIYFTAITSNSAGTINSISLIGSGRVAETAIQAVPSGIAVDTARSKLYWTNSRGRIQSADLDGSGIRNVVTGLGNPTDIVISNSIQAPKTETKTATAGKSKYDINGDGSVDSMDVDAIVIAVAAGLTDAKYDVNGDGKVDIFDVSAVSANRNGGAASAPTLLGTQFSALEVTRLQEQIHLLIATGDRSPDTLRILTYLQQLIVMARPEKTQLLANYPNPFNPETWIPYELATDTDVSLTIYNSNGVVVRALQLGRQPAGYYTDRDRAAYWDGRNALGESVASGIYFYQLETESVSSMRKMVILK